MYVNLQASSVQVYDENRHPITVLPWSRRSQHPGALFVVRGTHYQQFVSGAGPLYPFPGDAIPPPAVAPSSDELQAREVARARQDRELRAMGLQAKDGKLRLAGDVIRAGTVVGETQQAFATRIRSGLAGVGINSAEDFRHAPREALLRVPGVTEDNVARVREMDQMLFPPKEVVQVAAKEKIQQAHDKAAETGSRVCVLDIGRGTQDFLVLTEEAFDREYVGRGHTVICWVDPPTTIAEPPTLESLETGAEPVERIYRRADLDALDLKGLRAVVESEGFEMSKAGPVDTLRERLIAALMGYDQFRE